ncbi:MAG: hypothetical protein JW874_06185 [Spirochaetales bacterium]|nr:hypothetical protein [Spirochaetales bacterium]
MVLLLTAFFLLPDPVFAGGREEKPADGKTIVLEGRIALTGNEPHTALVLITADRQYRISGKLLPEIREKYQGRTVRLEAVLVRGPTLPLLGSEIDVIKLIRVLD